MRIKIIFIIMLAFILSSCSSDRITHKVTNVYGDEHVQHATIEFLRGSSTVLISDAEIDYLGEKNTGGGSTRGSRYTSVTIKSLKGFANPEVLHLKISNIKAENGDDLAYSVEEKIPVNPVEKCQSYVADEPVPSDKAFVLNKIHVSPYSVVISGSGTLEKSVEVEVQNSAGESFNNWKGSSKLQEENSFMLAMNFFRKMDNTNITTILINGVPFKVVPSEPVVFES